jgi:hypothetical protein
VSTDPTLAPSDWGSPAAVAETHVSVLVFLGDRVYKMKKPVSMGFLDFSTREARLAACRAEVELNRRLAPDVYLGVADVVGDDGTPCDHLVVMRRMPPERRLAALVRSGGDVDAELVHIARRVAAFHAAAGTSPEIARAGSRDAVRANWDASFEQLTPFVGPVLDPGTCARVEQLVHRYLEGRGPLFERRMATGQVRDGHGDLQAEDIFCLEDGPRILDCIEFDDRLRHGDVLADVAFLAMDLERLGAPAAGERFLALYREFAGETYPASLASHYVAYRAHVRAKVACLRHGQGDSEAAGAARELLALTLRHLEAGRVVLVLVGGLPGTGKSTLAAGMADQLGWSVLRSDEVRKDLAGLAHDQSATADFGEGLYRPETTAEVYRTLLERAEHALELGEPVVLDASWSDQRFRDAAAEVAKATSSELVELRCDAPADVAAGRIDRRRKQGGDPSDATVEVATAMAASADPWPSAVRIDTAGEIGAALAQALAAVGPNQARMEGRVPLSPLARSGK